MSERSHRSKRSSWRARERKIRAEYRGKIAIAIVISLIVGLIGGVIVDKCVFTNKTPSTTTASTATTTDTTVPEESELTAETTDTAMPNLFGNESETPTQAPIREEEPEEFEPVEEAADTEGWDEVEPELPSEEEEAPVAAPTLAINTDNDENDVSEDEDNAFADALTEPEEAATEEPTEVATEASTEEPAEAPTEVPTEEPTEAPTEAPTEEPTEAPTETPTEEPTAEPTEAPTGPIIVPYGTAYTLTTDINPDGSAHMQDDGTEFENVSITVRVKKYLDFDYYDRTYGSKYNLKGGTAAVVLELTMNNYTGTTQIIPQNFLLITFCNESGDITTQGVQIIDAEISGNTGIAITSDVPATVYKRYYKEDAGEMTYMVVTTYNNGIEQSYWFEIIIPPEMITPEPTADPNLAELTVGSRGDDVVKLQQTLIDAGYLDERADGIFGNNTAEAVKKMQKQFGMEETGVADPLFLTYLYMDTED